MAQDEPFSNPDRRAFLGTALAGAAGLGLGLRGSKTEAGEGASGTAVPGASKADDAAERAAAQSYDSARGFAAPALETVRIGFVGVGLQGGSHVRNFLGIEGVEIKALCDIDAARAEEVSSWVVEAGRPAPDLYTRGNWDFRRLCERDDIDLVFNSTPWEWHVPACVEAMEAGKHTAVEVPAAFTVDGCWQLVETAERTRRHCVMMENCCYGKREMMMLRMVRAGLFGEILHAEGAYIHDLRAIKLGETHEGLWRWQHSVTRNGNLYPTHGLGPIAQCLDINRGDSFDYLVSMSSPARGLDFYAKEKLPASDPRHGQRFALGDMNTSLIHTRKGRTVLLQHDTTTPRPYDRLDLVQGTRGIFSGYPDRLHIEGRSPEHQWEEPEAYAEEWGHPLWKKFEAEAEGAGHGGMDYLEDYRLVQSLLHGEPMDMDVYDAAAWSVVTELSEISVKNRSRAVDFPDFTRGRWKGRTPVETGG